ncbi:CocE/NonD family hydrolase C-terminal non-catalytic domain-containing protein [Nocardia wallacei]|uniref:CocE/NonD family hydrolase C-terminal non-catalytic domain-containing protein n=1 Tax=Nocardia wallacei TaxID=480035 RepID=UPI002453C234|nr:CocE/NonD family hydrolase C-terminal non-catalytic domain-containing protein [Nocardia wallacei]
MAIPRRTLRAETAPPLVPGTSCDLDIEINPTEALLRAGHRLRIAVAPGSFPRHYLPRALKRRIGAQTIMIDPAALATSPSWRTDRWVVRRRDRRQSSRGPANYLAGQCVQLSWRSIVELSPSSRAVRNRGV